MSTTFWVFAAIFLIFFGHRVIHCKRYFHFLDKTGEIHCHRTMPVVVQLDSTNADSKRYLWIDPQFEHPKGEETEHGVLNLDDFVVASHILEVHLGGIRRKHRVWPNNPKVDFTWWTIIQRRGSNMEVGGGDCFLQSVTAEPDTILRLIWQVEKISTYAFVTQIANALKSHDQTVQGKTALQKKLNSANGLLDWLGIGVTALHRELKETRAWSRSKVGDIASTRLEALLGPCTVGQSDCWMQGKPTPEGETAYAAIVAERQRHLAFMAEHPAPASQPAPPTPAGT